MNPSPRGPVQGHWLDAWQRSVLLPDMHSPDGSREAPLHVDGGARVVA